MLAFAGIGLCPPVQQHQVTDQEAIAAARRLTDLFPYKSLAFREVVRYSPTAGVSVRFVDDLGHHVVVFVDEGGGPESFETVTPRRPAPLQVLPAMPLKWSGHLRS
jgi:hypothetical protein